MSTASIGLGLTAISALGALFAAIAAWRSARSSRDAVEAQLLSNQMEENGADKN